MNKNGYDKSFFVSTTALFLYSKQALIRMGIGTSGAHQHLNCSLADVTCSLCTWVELCGAPRPHECTWILLSPGIVNVLCERGVKEPWTGTWPCPCSPTCPSVPLHFIIEHKFKDKITKNSRMAIAEHYTQGSGPWAWGPVCLWSQPWVEEFINWMPLTFPIISIASSITFPIDIAIER